MLASAIAITVLGAAALATVNRAPRLVPLGLAGLALATPVLVGHTQTIQPLWMMMIADLGHLAAGAFWVGGIAGLLRYLIAVSPAKSLPKPAPQDGGVRAAPRADPHPTPRATPQQAAQVVVDFSCFALISVIVLAVSGALMAVLILGNVSALFTTDYGRTLLIKLGIVAAVIVLAAWNRARLIPRLMARPDEVGQWISLRRIMIGEAVLLACVLTVTGFLSNTSPNASGAQGSGSSSEPSEPSAPPASTTPIDVTSQGLTVTGEATREGSAPTAEQTLRFTLEYEGEPLVPPQLVLGDVTVDARLQSQGLGPLPAELEFDEATGEYVATFVLPAAGEWQVQVAVRVDTYSQPIALFALDVS